MHDRIFERPGDLSPSALRRLAQELPIDLETYDRDLRSGEARRLVDVDLESGEEDGVADTPTLFVNGRMHVGQYEFLPLLDALRSSPPS
jgi:predicted DsbA family dithiol-disulfide isomerase